MSLKFEWNGQRAVSNKRKHDVTFEEASTGLSDFLSTTIPDPLHPGNEERLITIGRSDKHRALVVVHTDRGDVVRLISSLPATAHEKNTYEEGHG